MFIVKNQSYNYIVLNFLALFWISFCVFMIGFRYNVGTDYPNYETWFHYWYKDITFEWIYTGVNYILKVSGGEFHYLTLLISLFSSLLLIFGIYKWNIRGINVILVLFLYTVSYLFLFANTMRQGVAIIIFFIAARYIVERKFFKFLFWIFLGAGFHLSIIFMIPFYFIYKIQLRYTIFVLLVIASYLIVGLNLSQKILEFLLSFSPYAQKYLNSDLLSNTENSILSPGVLIKTLIAILLLVKLKNIPNEYKIAMNFYMIGTIFRIFAISSYLFNRLGMYFQFFEIICIVILLNQIKNKYFKILLYGFVIIIHLLLLYKLIIIDAEANDFIYNSIFEK
ncbi:EpsG family protein [Ureibacillus sp. FSL K6-0786]